MTSYVQNSLSLIKAPYTSEKSSVISEKHKQFAFKVSPRANKDQVKIAIETMFKVDVTDVNIVNVKSKQKRLGRIQGKTKSWKKAYVTINPEQDLSFVE